MSIERGAVISSCGTFRYRLWRRWCSNVRPITFIMLNPSTADADVDDPTIRKCIGFAKRLGHGAIEVVNLYAYRATSPKDLRAAGYPEGPQNPRYVFEACNDAHMVICAWGSNARDLAAPNRVRVMLAARGIVPYALAFTDDGVPRHPLMLPYSCTPVRLQ